MERHDEELRRAFDGQAPTFERGRVFTDPVALSRLVAFTRVGPGARVLDAGCGPGLVAQAFLESGCVVHGVDLSTGMLSRARERCARFGDRVSFEHGSVLESAAAGPFDAAVSRFVVHHVQDPLAFLRAQVARVRPGGTVVVADHTTDTDAACARWHQEVERGRDKSHVRNLTTGQIADAFAAAGLSRVELVEDGFELDFDEWFDRGTPVVSKEESRRMLLAGRARGFEPEPRPDGGITIHCVRVLARGLR